MITLFTIAGTGHPGMAGAGSTGRGCFPQQVAKRVNPTKYRWSPISYAAALPFTRSVARGITKLTDAINSTDGEFAIAAYSQGVMVTAPRVSVAALRTAGAPQIRPSRGRRLCQPRAGKRAVPSPAAQTPAGTESCPRTTD